MPDSSSARDTVSQYLSMREMREIEDVLVGAVKEKKRSEMILQKLCRRWDHSI